MHLKRKRKPRPFKYLFKAYRSSDYTDYPRKDQQNTFPNTSLC